MKKILAVAALAVLGATSAFADTTPGTGVLNSKHDINLTANLVPDTQGRVCAFCHTPHHALVDPTGGYAPLWSHEFTSYLSGTPYASATFDAGLIGAIDPLVGPSRLCMSCHDGLVAPDQHYALPGTLPVSGRFAADDFQDPPAIAVGLNGDFSNDHPIGFRIADTLDATGPLGGDPAIYPDILTNRTWLIAGAAGTVPISRGLYVPAGSTLADGIMTCATCHDVHNTDNVENNAANQQDAAHVDQVQGNYFVFAPQSGSQLCLSCHDK